MAKETKPKASQSEEANQTAADKPAEAMNAPDEAVQKGAASAASAPAKGLTYDVKFSSFPNEGNIKGYCSVTIGGEFAVKGVKVIQSSNGLFVAMPSYKAGDEYKDICNPVTKEAREHLNDAVLKAYEQQSQAHVANMGASGMPENFHFANDPSQLPFQ